VARKNMKKTKGFTLIELLVVIAIIGLIASITMVAVKNSRDKAKFASTAQFVATVQHSLGAFSAGIWNLGEGSGTTTADSSGNGNSGTVSSSLAWATDNPSGSGSSFSSSGSYYVDCGNKSSLDIKGKITVMAWVKRNVLAGDAGVISKKNATTNYELGITSAGNMFIWDGSNKRTSTKTIATGEWHHIAMSINSGTVTFYLDGAVDNSIAGVNLNVASGVNLFIGKGTPTGEYFSGLIDDARVYSEAITLTQIQKIYTEGVEKLGLASK
jgi:prepilin-type N-terminal cleavage/methylation domain-containing protein